MASRREHYSPILQARPLRRAATNENEDNASTRVTRAKAAALGAPADAIMKKPLVSKKSVANVQPGNIETMPRKRTALGDVSNVAKPQTSGVQDSKKSISVAKAAHPTGIHKSARVSSTRSAQKTKDGNDLKRPASTTSTADSLTKKRATLSGDLSRQPRRPEEAADAENIEPSEARESKLITEVITTTTTTVDGARIEKEIKKEERVVDAAQSKHQQMVAAHIEFLDQEDEADPLMVGEYVYEIVDYMKRLEVMTLPNPDYMKMQAELQWSMRGILIDWLLEVHIKFHLLPETLYLAVNIIDRFLSEKVIQLDRLQLVGVTALFIASKYEEVLSPHIGNFSHVADDGFSDSEILSAERFILSTLRYDLSFPNPMHFIRRISKADGYDMQTRTLAKYLLEISILDHRFLEYAGSQNAAAAMYLARLILNKGDWVSG